MKYTYRCNRCHLEFEKDLKLKDVANAAKPPKFPCPQCGGTSRKLINGVSVHYKGSGFTLSKDK